jgi:hypothetical protein
LIVLSAALPYDAAYYKEGRNTIVLCYGSLKPANNRAMAAGLNIIFNPKRCSQGILPVDIYERSIKRPRFFSKKILFDIKDRA